MSAVPRDAIHPGLGIPQISGEAAACLDEVLTPLALQLLRSLHRRFNGRRLQLLATQTQQEMQEEGGGAAWESLLRSQLQLRDAVRRSEVADDGAVKLRPRGWHVPETHVQFAGAPVSGALFDFAVFAANNYEALGATRRQWLELPEHAASAAERLWSDVFAATENALGLTPGTFETTRPRAT